MLEQLGLARYYELGQLVVARDTAGTFYWVVETAAERFLGDFTADAVAAWRETTWSWLPWTNPDWPGTA